MLDRLEWVLKHRELSGAEWVKRAGLSAGFLGTAKSRAKRNPNFKPDHDSLVKLAAAARVSLRWLEDDDGDPDDARHIPAAETGAEAKQPQFQPQPQPQPQLTQESRERLADDATIMLPLIRIVSEERDVRPEDAMVVYRAMQRLLRSVVAIIGPLRSEQAMSLDGPLRSMLATTKDIRRRGEEPTEAEVLSAFSSQASIVKVVAG